MEVPLDDAALQLLIDLHLPNPRQGPGSDAQTRRAIELSGLAFQSDLRVADIGCGTGAAALVLAESLDAQVTAVDLLPAFLEVLNERATCRRVSDRITTVAASMDALPFEPESFDAIWSEGAIYNLGFEDGIVSWRDFIAPGGVLAVSDLTWLTHERPAEIDAHWQEAYPDVATAATRFALLEARGFSPIGYFPLPATCWLENYYEPLEARFDAFLEEQGHSEAALACVAEERHEVALYRKYAPVVSYGFYIARKL